jgi:hypothetical protein
MEALMRLTLSKRDHDAVFLDMDGVLTDTARLHAAAWKCLFDDFLRRRAVATGEAFVPFDAGADYLAYVDGKSREDGVRHFLASRSIRLPEGSAEDPDEAETLTTLARRKDSLFAEELRAGVKLVPGAGVAARPAASEHTRRRCHLQPEFRCSARSGRPCRVSGHTGGWDGCGGASPARQAGPRPVSGGRAAPRPSFRLAITKNQRHSWTNCLVPSKYVAM